MLSEQAQYMDSQTVGILDDLSDLALLQLHSKSLIWEPLSTYQVSKKSKILFLANQKSHPSLN